MTETVLNSYREKISSPDALRAAEEKHRTSILAEAVPYAWHTEYPELAGRVFPDRFGKALSEDPLYLYESFLSYSSGMKELVLKTYTWLTAQKGSENMDILSVAAGMKEGGIRLLILIRTYQEALPDIRIFLKTLRSCRDEEGKQTAVRQETDIMKTHPENRPAKSYFLYPEKRRIIPQKRKEQLPGLLNRSLSHLAEVERLSYVRTLRGEMDTNEFEKIAGAYLKNELLNTGKLSADEAPVFLKEIMKELFGFSVLEDLIVSRPEVSDISVTSPAEISCRISGKEQMTGLYFADREAYLRFVSGLLIRNRKDPSLPFAVFSDDRNKDLLLRITVTAPFVTGTRLPYVHIRKIPRKKLHFRELSELGMFPEKVGKYILSCGKGPGSVIISGPPGAGKTVLLNWFLEEAYEENARILVIQETEELFAERKGVMITHTVSGTENGEQACSLEKLGRMALTSGAGVFIIGEVKGAEVSSAVTLANAGCRTAMTIHAASAETVPERMADLAGLHRYGSREEFYRLLSPFQTVISVCDFHVEEIRHFSGFDDSSGRMKSRVIYRRNEFSDIPETEERYL